MTNLLRSRRRPLLAGAATAAGLFLAGCAESAPQDTWAPSGPNAQKIDDLQRPVFLVAGVIGVIVFVVIGYIVFRYRDRGQAIPEQSHGKPALEISLTILPALILAVVGAFTVRTIFDLAETGDTEMVVNVTGNQWWWEYDYPVQDEYGIESPIITSGQLVIPANTKVMLRITSRDVIHSYWIPKLNGKKDAVPGRLHTLRLEADQPGIYAGQCTEFCGLSHANMRMEAVALSPADFRAWVERQQQPQPMLTDGSLAAEGQGVFIAQCSRCHQVDGLERADGSPIIAAPDENVWSGAAPDMTHFASRNTFAGATWDLLTPACRDDVWNASPAEFGPKYLTGVTEQCLNQVDLREWLRNAPGKKPMYADPTKLEDTGGLYRGMPYLALSEDDIDRLVAYLITLK
jgi:cytochrome c oxidase subunit II